MKNCYKCQCTKELTAFHKDKSKHDGLEGICKSCSRIKNAKWIQENPNKAFLRHINKTLKKRVVKWDRELTDLVTEEAALLRTLRKNATGLDWEMDHIVPLNGKNVCGLHVWNNIQVITAEENRKKSNKWQS
jgi:5-methylcytosine-specific restriction endonuclease McrA